MSKDEKKKLAKMLLKAETALFRTLDDIIQEKVIDDWFACGRIDEKYGSLFASWDTDDYPVYVDDGEKAAYLEKVLNEDKETHYSFVFFSEEDDQVDDRGYEIWGAWKEDDGEWHYESCITK